MRCGKRALPFFSILIVCGTSRMFCRFRYTGFIRDSIHFEPWPAGLPGSLALESGEWHAWAMEHAAGWPESCLTGEERERADRFRRAQDRDAFVSTRVMLRHLLAAYTGTAPSAIELTHGARKKPGVAGGGIHFNVSHSAGMSLLAFAREEVGVDIESVRAVSDMDAIVKRNFGPGEQQEWHALAPEEREEAFFLGWTRKEAYIKALGEGLHFPLGSFDVSLSPDVAAEFRNVPGWLLYDFAIPGYAAALAIRGAEYKGQAWKLEPALAEAIVTSFG
jgi:4'-phosphopantetheinyl transferase